VTLPIVGVRQIKLLVSDLSISARGYADLFDLELADEFTEDGAVRGVVLADHEAGFVIGLREREQCARVRSWTASMCVPLCSGRQRKCRP